MSTRFADSAVYAHLWGSDEVRAIFEEDARLCDWLAILAALATAQADLGIIPRAAAAAIAPEALAGHLDVDLMAAETRRTGHSMLGLIRALQAVLPPEAGEFVYYGATVQDVTDTWTALCVRRVGALVWRQVRALEGELLDLADAHRETVMAGRTHGQIGSPITFGLKVASWADELRRHLDRLREGAPRWLVGQLGGGVGTLAIFGPQGLALRARFCERLGLGDPGVPWLAARDRVAEFAHLLAMVTATLARMGNEVYQLQRPEIAELCEPALPDAVSSITMPHKRNPEAAEHLVTLARLARLQASGLLEGMVAEHERDGRAWKAEWVTFPEVCLLTGAALATAGRLVAGLEVSPIAMAASLAATRDYAASEAVLAALAPKVGKHRAQTALQAALARGLATGVDLDQALGTADASMRDALTPERQRQILAGPDAGSAAAMVEAALSRARAARAKEADTWP
ncbi:MAG: class-II fumarase/aspartase family protein [Acidimicrobiales bacterium]